MPLGIFAPELAYLSLVAAVAGFTQGLTGFGAVLVGLPLAALYLDLPTAVPLLNLLGVAINLQLAAPLHRWWRGRIILWLTAASLPGLGLGTWVLTLAPAALLEALLGLTLGLVVLQPHRLKPLSPAPGPWAAVAAGLLAGFLGGTLAANGPPVVFYATLQPWAKDEIKATLVGYFLLSGLILVAWQAGAGLLSLRVLGLGAGSLPALWLGVTAGARLYRRLPASGYRRLLQWFLGFLGLWFLGRAAGSGWCS